MKDSSLHHVISEPRRTVSGERPPALILLHGVRSNEHDLLGLAPALDDRFFVISARAPLTLGPGQYGWYHVEFTPTGYIIDEEEAVRGRDTVLGFVEDVRAKYPIDPDRVFLMGFSQGCIMSVGAAFANPRLFAGIVGMSGRLLDSMPPDSSRADEYKGLPVTIVHGVRDSVIPIQYGREIRDTFSRLPVDLTYKEYPMAHNVSNESLIDIGGWLTTRLDSRDWRAAGA